LDRSVAQNAANNQITDPLVSDIFQARQALGMKDIPGALHLITVAQALTGNI
jgi:hypothetical protein